MKYYWIILIVSIFALSFLSCSKTPDESKMKTSIINYFKEQSNLKAKDLDLPPDENTPSNGKGMIFYKDVNVTSLEFIDSRKSNDGNSYEVTVKISGSALRCINMGMNEQHTSVYEIEDKTVSFSNSKQIFTFKKDKYGDWVYDF